MRGSHKFLVRLRLAPAVALLLASPATPLAQSLPGGIELPEAVDPAPAPNATTIPLADSAPEDAAIADRLRDIFSAVDALSAVEPTVRAGVVTLQGTAPDAAAAAKAAAIAERVQGVVTVVDRIERTASAGESLEPGIERLGRRLRDAIRTLPLVAAAILLFTLIASAGVLLARWRALFSRLAANSFVGELAAQAVRILFIVIGLVVALDFVGATSLLGAILGAAGILGLAIGFAVRDTIENYVASVLLSVRQPFAPNDFVEIEGQEGFVVRLTSRATILLTAAGNHVRLPNAAVYKGTIVNYTRNPERRFEFALGVNADADLKAAIALGIETLDRLDYTLEKPRPGGWIESVGDSSVVVRFVGWIDQTKVDFLQARSEGIRLVKQALEGAGFELPEPIYRLRIEDRERGTRQAAPRVPPQPAPPVLVDVRRIGSVEQKVAAERSERSDDLLDPRAPSE